MLASVVPVCADEDAFAKSPDNQPLPGFERRELTTYRLKVTLKVEALGNGVTQVAATGPIPIDWREQTVRLLEETRSPGVSVREQKFGKQGAVVILQSAAIPERGSAAVERIYEVTRYGLKFIADPATLQKPEKIPPELREYLRAAPGVETLDPHIRKLAESLQADDENAWTTVRAIYDWVRGNVQYQQGNLRGAAETLDRKVGDCEDMTALFVALCRNVEVPARTVWIEAHAYAEFYLEDELGRGYWIPAELAGPPFFGQTAETRPILQKGDRLHDPIKRRDAHYLPQSARAVGGRVNLVSTRTIEGLSD